MCAPAAARPLDTAAQHGLRVMVGLPWSQHVAFLDDSRLKRAIRHEIVGKVAEIAGHPAVLMLALGNEIPASVVRWHGRLRVERFPRQLYQDAKERAPETLFTYVNFPPTEFLDLSFLDVCAFNVYLHREPELRAYIARLQHIAGHKPLLLAEAGADSIREGEAGQADITAMHVRAAFEEGACGAVAYAWTDEWWRGGHPVVDWSFGLVDRERRPKPAALAVQDAFANAPFPPAAQRTWPKISVVVCAYNAADTLEDCLSIEAHLSGLRSALSIRVEDRTGTSDPAPDRASDRNSQRRAQRRTQRRSRARNRRDCRLHRRGRPRRSRLAHLSRAAVPHLGRRRLGRAERRAARRSADGAVDRARARRSDARPAGRSRGRARAWLQHGVSS